MSPEEISSPGAKMSPAVLIGATVLLVFVIVIVYLWIKMPGVVAPFMRKNPAAPLVAPAQSLGGELYEKTQNPLEDKLPQQSPIVNPIKDVYKNPFE